jgi:hypothetical protein
MIREALVQLSLDNAFLCAEPDCKTVSNDSSQCPRCHSAVLNLGTIIDGKPAQSPVLESDSRTEERANEPDRQLPDHQSCPVY